MAFAPFALRLRRRALIPALLLALLLASSLSNESFAQPLTFTTFAGKAGQSGNVDGTGTNALFNRPIGIAVDGAGNVYVADFNNGAIRKITRTGLVTNFATGIPSAQDVMVDAATNVFVLASGAVTRIAPDGTRTTILGGLGNSEGIAGDSAGNIYISHTDDQTVWKRTPAGVVSTFASGVGYPREIKVDGDGNVYVAGAGNQVVWRITAAGTPSIFAGAAGGAGTNDGPRLNARFNDASGVAVDAFGDLFVADRFNYTIRKIDASGIVSTVAGLPGVQGSADGTGSTARFSEPTFIVADNFGNIYVTDGFAHTIRKASVFAIASQPQDRTVLVGSNATFGVSAHGVPPLFFQWFFNQTNLLAGQTNAVLTLTNVELIQAGVYLVLVSNAVDSVFSSNAVLTILAPGPDNDSDGLANELEFRYGTNPLNPDTDGDGLSDYEELFAFATDPLKPDSDGDGMPDGWEIQHGLNPRFNDAADDLDGDGLSNLAEYNWSLSHPNQPIDPRTKYSTSATVSDFAVVTGTGTNQFFYDRNNRLIGAEFDRGLALAYVYDSNDNLVRQVSMKHDANTNGLPDVWEFLNGLTNNTSAHTDTDGDGWTDYQEWKAGTNPHDPNSAPNLLGNPGTQIASLQLPFTPSNFVLGVGQLDGLGAEEIVLGADGNPGTNINFLLVLTQGATTWSTQRVDVGQFGITSIAIGQPTNRPSVGIFVGLRGTTNGSGRVMEFTSNGGLWQSNVVALSTNQDASVLGVRGPGVLVSLATTNSPDGSLSAVNFSTNWSLSLADTNTSHRGLGTLFQPQPQTISAVSLRLLDSGGVAVGRARFSVLAANLVSYWALDESSGNAADSVGSNTLTNNNTVIYSSGLINNGANFGNDGSYRYLRRPDTLGLTVDQAKSFSFWLKMNYDADSLEAWPLQIGFYTGSALTSGSVNFSYKGSTHNLYLSKGDNNGHGATINHPITLGTTTWHHLVGTTDGATWSFYVDGTLAGTAADYVNNGGNGTFSPAFFTLGAADRPDRFNMDEVGVWSRALSAGEVNLLFGNGYGVANPGELTGLLLPEPFATRTNNWRGSSLGSGFLRGTNGSSIFYTFADDKNANGLIDFADDFVTAEYLASGTNASLLTLSRRPIAALTPAQSYGLASVNFLNASNEVFFTGEPDGQVFAWTATGATNPLQRQLFSGHHAGKAWHALAGVKTLGPGEALVGLRIGPTNPNVCNVILWPPQSQLPQLASLPQTAPAAAVLPQANALGSPAAVTIRLWDAEGNASTPFLQYQWSGTTNWLPATLTSLDGAPYSTTTRVAASPGGANHTVVWNAQSDLGLNVSTNILLRARAQDFSLVGDWSVGTPFQINTATTPDADGNGLPDWWELQYFGHTGVDPNDDPDGDSFKNWQEYIADTNPTNTASHLSLSVGLLSDGVKLDWLAGSNSWKYLQRTISLSETNGAWLNIWTSPPPPSPISGSYTDLFGTTAMQFYRIKVTR